MFIDEFIEKLFVLFLKSGDSDMADIIESVKHLILRHISNSHIELIFLATGNLKLVKIFERFQPSL